jgi:hypothetical protein
MAKIASTIDIIYIAKKAKKMKLNRQLPEKVIDQLDSTGKHLLSEAMLHGDDSHVRCHVYLKLAHLSSDQPAEGDIDIPLEMYNKLPDAE